MLCEGCNSISFQFDGRDADVRVRRYSSLFELRSSAEHCAFCSLVHMEMKCLEDPDTGQYCKESWGLEFFNRLLEHSPVDVHHRSHGSEHNVFLRCFLDAQNTVGYPGGPISLELEEMLGGIYVTPDSLVADVVSGRPFDGNLSKAKQIAIAKERFDECKSTHNECNTDADPNFMPARVLDLKPDKLQNELVGMMSVPEGFKKPYATLSYCWGNSQNVKLTKDLLHQFMGEGIPLHRLPTTIREACELCIALDIRYLWVCSLCIVQDVDLDWQQQSAEMSAIYNCSDLTLSAAAGKDCEAGIFRRASSKAQCPAEMKWYDTRDAHGTCWVRQRLVPHGFKEPSELRGWTLQETLLSRRLLVMGTAQISWQCASSRWNQSGTVYRPIYGSNQIFPCPPLEYAMHCGIEALPNRKDSIHEIWQRLVRNYARRGLTLPKDKLPAISGIAKWLSHRFLNDEKYLAGLWSSQLPQCLLWYNSLVYPASEDQARKPTAYRAPSWTWASLDSQYLEWLETPTEEYYGTVLDHGLSYKGIDSFGEVSGGHLEIEAPLKTGWLVPSANYPEQFDLWRDNWIHGLLDNRPKHLNDSLGPAHLDVYSKRDVGAAAGRVGREDRVRPCECLRITTKAGLLLAQHEERDGNGDSFTNERRVRVGLVVFKEDSGAEWWSDAPKTKVYLV